MAATEQPLIDLNGFDQPQPPKDAMAVAEGAGPDGHVLTVIAKRMRAAKKKLTRIERIEKSRQEGKAINSDQVLSKPDVLLLGHVDGLKAAHSWSAAAQAGAVTACFALSFVSPKGKVLW